VHCDGAPKKQCASKAIISERSPRYFRFPCFALKESLFKYWDEFLHSFGLKITEKGLLRGFEWVFPNWHVV